MSQGILPKQEEIHSSATIKSHPIHPMLVVFPIASQVGLLISDIVYMLTNDSFWAYASYWLLISTLITGILAALVGAVDFLLNPRIRRINSAWIHALGNLVFMSIVVINFLIRNSNYVETIFPWGIALSAVAALVLIFTGWHGAEMVYRHKVGIDSRGVKTEEKDPVIENRVERADLS